MKWNLNRLIKLGIWIVLPILLCINMFIFVSGIILGNQITRFEQETKKIHEQNIGLTIQASHFDSLEYAASVAASLNFVKKASPVFLDNLKYALNR